ncbi:glycosyltransferase 87 family protein [Stieleria sp. ICT_E10.1]|uniref:glycosyltransferase 87 family protein n=1 Tax=Stieleria sedimenti TaxID=2976331 RepID=UPI00217FE894|nr:glycosyltransferase 87 family protein [Stieleria sedimenti]MCS7468264.1 glycosyltransferase 87 family protein [Stieleria sedimenti]
MNARNRRFVVPLVACLLFGIGVTLAAVRTVTRYQTPGSTNPATQGMCDFHNGLYFPATALLAGKSPYGQQYADEYPVSRQIPFFSPVILVLHAPLTFLPLPVADVLFFALSVVLVIVLATLCANAAGVGIVGGGHLGGNAGGRLTWIASIAAAIVFSRSGHISLYNGYFTIELALATIAAIHFAKDRPVISAVALTLVSAKPTFILPLGFLMLARGNFKALSLGAAISLLGAGLPMTYLAYHEGIRATGSIDLAAGFDKIVDDIGSAQQVHMKTQDESPVDSWTRLDALATVCKWTGSDPGQIVHLAVMMLILLWPMMILFYQSRRGLDDGVAGGTGCLMLVTILTSLYHQSYDAMVVVAPTVGMLLACTEFWRSVSPLTRGVLGALMVVPAFNYLSTRSVLTRLDLGDVGFGVITSLSGVALMVAWLVICVLLTRRTIGSRNRQTASGASDRRACALPLTRDT